MVIIQAKGHQRIRLEDEIPTIRMTSESSLQVAMRRNEADQEETTTSVVDHVVMEALETAGSNLRNRIEASQIFRLKVLIEEEHKKQSCASFSGQRINRKLRIIDFRDATMKKLQFSSN